jgi:hypothetical protein
MRKVPTTLLTIALCAFNAHGAQADAIVLDQRLLPPATIGVTLGYPFSIAQTFTVGVPGTLARVDVFLFPVSFNSLILGTVPGDLILDVRPTVGGVPSDTASLARVSVPAASVAPSEATSPNSLFAVSFDVSQFGVPVTAGDLLAFELQSTAIQVGDPNYSVAAIGDTRFTRGYCCGDAFARDAISHPSFSSDPNEPFFFHRGSTDFLFRTFVQTSAPAPTPEPATSVLFISGAALMSKRMFRW